MSQVISDFLPKARTNSLKVITANIEKGGTGKTTLVFNSGEYDSQKKDLSVLLIDQDKSLNLTTRYSKYDFGLIHEKNKISNLYKGKEIEPIHIHENLDILVASPDLAEIDTQIKEQHNSRLILFSWITKNYQDLNEKYDYIIIDTHNDTTLLTENALAVADIIIGVSDPSMDGFDALLKLGRHIEGLKSSLVEVVSGESYVAAKYYIIGNKVKHNTNSSKEFKEIIEKEANYLGFIQDKELVNQANLEQTPIVEFANNPKVYREHQEFFDSTFSLYDKILDMADRSQED